MEVAEVPKAANDAFIHNTIPTVRAIEKQVRASVLRDKERLRALVGGNYRDLLSTAEEIVALDQHTRKVEIQISELSRQCKPPSAQVADRSTSVFSSTAAQLRLLIQCITCAASALQTRSILLCAELVVVARLLLKSISEHESPPKAIESLRNKGATLRRRLLRFIDYQLAHPSSSVDTLVQSICAYCLVTSASSGDAVKHFRDVRLDKLRQRVNSEDKDQKQTKENYRYLVTSVQSLKALLGHSVNDALSQLQRQPILQDHNILKLEALDTDRLRNLIPQDIISFTPYIKRVLLKQDDIQELSSDWVREACQIFTKGLRAVLAQTSSVGDVFALRKDLCSAILPVYFSVYAGDTLLETVCEASNARILELCQQQGDTLIDIGRAIATAEHKQSVASLWDTSSVQLSSASNSAKHVRQVQSSHLGTKGSLNQSIKKLRVWARNVTNLRNQFSELASIRWQDLLEEPDDEDEDTAQQVVTRLSKDDPEHFTQALTSSIQSTTTQFNTILSNAADEVIQSQIQADKIESAIARIVYIIRALRESSHILTNFVPNTPSSIVTIVSSLYNTLADRVTIQIISSLPDSKSNNTHLPVDMPSPVAFKLLRDICAKMADVGGTDIWSSAAVLSLKGKLRAKILDSENTYLSTEFDRFYIAAALGASDPEKPTTSNSDGHGGTEAKATAYWARTHLLFGALG